MTDTGENQNPADNKKYCANWVRYWSSAKNIGSRIFNGLNIASPFITAVATALLVWVAYWQYQALRNTDDSIGRQLRSQNSLLDLSTRAILVTDFDRWALFPTEPAKESTVAFEIKNVGKTFAHVLSATYEMAVAADPPITFMGIRRIPNFPALIGPDVKAVVVLPHLQIGADELGLIGSEKASVWIRTIFNYRDDNNVTFELRFTGRYGRGVTSTGANGFRFVFPDTEIPRKNWPDTTGLRCLNVVTSEPTKLGCN